ncbi:MAG: hypothetical protein J6A01_05240 [Proteobacteria bacterium]|nr:hypothetical protein [Pseudomonadota bacterium]
MNKTRFFISILALMLASGCADNKAFEVDLCPDDPNKTLPGICDCGTPDVDTDGDGTLDCRDLCPNNDGKASPGVCGCEEADVDTDGDGTMDCKDKCIDDPEKIVPGVCGCGVADSDTNGNNIVDCLEDILDLCPKNPNKDRPTGDCGCEEEVDSDGDGVFDCVDLCKDDIYKTEPGICGCGVPDEDRDGDDTMDCIDLCDDDRDKTSPLKCGCGVPDDDNDGDTIPDCMNECENGVVKENGRPKAFPGLCGCDKLDSPENTSDEDHDGVINCLDTCPHNPTKSKEADGDCNEMDSDGDSVDDSMDKCPYNPKIDTILEAGEKPGTDKECSTYVEAENIFYIYNAHNLEELRAKLKTIHEDTVCTGNIKSCILGTDTEKSVAARECVGKLWQYYSCSLCTPEVKNEETGEVTTPLSCASETPVELQKALTIELVNDINLIDFLPTSLKTNGECYSTWFEDFNLTNVVFHGNGNTISYKQNTNTCSLNYALFTSVTLSEISDLTIELNVSNTTASVYSRGVFTNDINSSKVSDIHVKGSLTTAYTGTTGTNAVGGIAGYVHSAYSVYGDSQVVGCDAQNIEVTSTAAALESAYLGGYFGYVTSASLTLSGKHVVKSVKSNRNAGGFFGGIAISKEGNVIDLKNADLQVESITAYNASGFAHSLSLSGSEDASLSVNSFKANNIQSTKANAAGFVNNLAARLKDIHSEIGTIASAKSAAGFAFMSVNNTLSNIISNVKEMKCSGDASKNAVFECAGFIHDVSSNIFDHVDSHVEKMTSTKDGAGFIHSVVTGFELKNSIIAVDNLEADNAYGIYANFAVNGTENKISLEGVHFSSDSMTSTSKTVGLFGNIPGSSAVFLNHVSAFANLGGADVSKIHSVMGEIATPSKTEPIIISLTNGFYAFTNVVDGTLQNSFTLLDTLTADNLDAIYKNQIENNYFLVMSDDTKLVTLSDNPFSSYVSLIKPEETDTALTSLQAKDSHWSTKNFSIDSTDYTLPAYVAENASTP